MRAIFSQDLDRAFSYNTSKVIVINDKKLGICLKLFQAFIFIYVFFLSFIYNESYYDIEISQGLSVIQSSGQGDTIVNIDSQSVFDNDDINPYLNGNTLFLATEAVFHFQQSKGTCPDFYSICTTNADCITAMNEVCTDTKCVGTNWCNTGPISQSITYDVTTNYYIWVRGVITYDRIFPNYIFTSMNDSVITTAQNPDKANCFSFLDILNANLPEPLSYREIQETGAVLHINVNWDCVGTSQCYPSIQVYRIDSFSDFDQLGSYQVKTNYYQIGGVTYRDLLNYTGIRMTFETKGKGMMFSASNLFLQFATFLALIRFAGMLFDVYAANLSPYAKRLHDEKYHVLDDLLNPSDAEMQEIRRRPHYETAEREESSRHDDVADSEKLDRSEDGSKRGSEREEEYEGHDRGDHDDEEGSDVD